MKRLFCLLCREAMALWTDSGNTPPPVFSRHIRKCRACAAYQAQQQALANQLREAARTHETPLPDPARATRILALAQASEVCGASGVRRNYSLRFAGGLAAVAVVIACLVIMLTSRHHDAVPTAPQLGSDPIQAFVWAESVLRGDALQAEWDLLTAETRTLATDLAEEVRLALL